MLLEFTEKTRIYYIYDCVTFARYRKQVDGGYKVVHLKTYFNKLQSGTGFFGKFQKHFKFVSQVTHFYGKSILVTSYI